jgi:hypothetical protein
LANSVLPVSWTGRSGNSVDIIMKNLPALDNRNYRAKANEFRE